MPPLDSALGGSPTETPPIETLVCCHCGDAFEKARGQANAQRRKHGPDVRFFCTRQCFSASRALGKPRAQLVAEKAAYDRAYRAKHRDMLKAKKQEYFQKTYDPDAAREVRKANRELHREYAKQYRDRPEWKAHKAEYDRAVRAGEYGAYGDAYKVLVALEKEIRQQPWYERAKERGYFDNDRQPNQRKRNEQVARY